MTLPDFEAREHLRKVSTGRSGSFSPAKYGASLITVVIFVAIAQALPKFLYGTSYEWIAREVADSHLWKTIYILIFCALLVLMFGVLVVLWGFVIRSFRREAPEMQQQSLVELLDSIEAELRRLRYLIGEPAPRQVVSSAFDCGQMSFEQWLGHVFLPNARAAVAANELPASSQVAAAAVRNLDGADEADTLLDLLSAFDSRINILGRAKGVPRGRA